MRLIINGLFLGTKQCQLNLVRQQNHEGLNAIDFKSLTYTDKDYRWWTALLSVFISPSCSALAVSSMWHS